MAGLAAIRTALAATIEAGTGWTCGAYPPRSVVPPVMFPAARNGEVVDTDGGSSVTIPIWAVVSSTHETQFDKLDQLIDGTSGLPAVIDDEPTLGLAGVSAVVKGWTEGEIEVNGATYWGVRFDVDVLYTPGAR